MGIIHHALHQNKLFCPLSEMYSEEIGEIVNFNSKSLNKCLGSKPSYALLSLTST